MPRHIDAYMDGVDLASVGPVLIQQVHEDAPQLALTEGERPGRYGSRLITRKRQTLRVTLEVAIRELFDLRARSHTMEAIAAWCRGSELQLSNHPSRRLLVECTAEPSLGAVRDYTATARLEFTAYNVPYWEDLLPVAMTLSGSTGSASVYVPGTVPSPIRLRVVPEAAMTAFSVTAAGQTVALTDLNVPAGGELILERDSLDNLWITVNGVSMLSHRTSASADDLMAGPGYVPVSFTADAACAVTIQLRGRWA